VRRANGNDCFALKTQRRMGVFYLGDWSIWGPVRKRLRWRSNKRQHSWPLSGQAGGVC